MNQVHTPTDHVLVMPSLVPAVRTASGNGIGVDCRGYTRAMVVVHLGAHDRTTGDETLDVKIQESSDDASADAYADVSGAAFAQFAAVVPAATKGNVYTMNIDLTKRERYLRAVGTAAGTTPSDAYSVVIYLYNAGVKPVTQTATPVSA